jgi:hypothetical protein
MAQDRWEMPDLACLPNSLLAQQWKEHYLLPEVWVASIKFLNQGRHSLYEFYKAPGDSGKIALPYFSYLFLPCGLVEQIKIAQLCPVMGRKYNKSGSATPGL